MARQDELRDGIIRTYAGWTALSALRSGSPVKSRDEIYPILAAINFDVLFGRTKDAVTIVEFDGWHRRATETICGHCLELGVGWATKLINVYLKTAAYVGDLGRPCLRDVLHPPIDGGLWDGLETWFKAAQQAEPGLQIELRALQQRTHWVRRIKSIEHYDEHYLTIIEGCREVAKHLGCSLIEVDQHWEGARSRTQE